MGFFDLLDQMFRALVILAVVGVVSVLGFIGLLIYMVVS